MLSAAGSVSLLKKRKPVVKIVRSASASQVGVKGSSEDGAWSDTQRSRVGKVLHVNQINRVRKLKVVRVEENKWVWVMPAQFSQIQSLSSSTSECSKQFYPLLEMILFRIDWTVFEKWYIYIIIYMVQNNDICLCLQQCHAFWLMLYQIAEMQSWNLPLPFLLRYWGSKKNTRPGLYENLGIRWS